MPIALAYSRETVFLDDAVRVVQGPAGELLAIGKGLESPPPGGESLGLAVFAKSVASDVVETIDQLVTAPGGEHSYWYALLHRLAATIGVGLVECPADDWLEIDDSEDLLRARRSSHAQPSGLAVAKVIAASSAPG
jgi:choline kinase